MKTYTFDEEAWAKLRAMAGRLCGGSDKMRDEGNLLVALMCDHAVEETIPEYTCVCCGQRIEDGRICGCGAR